LEQLRPTEQTSTYAILNVLRENCSPPYGASRPCGIWIVARLLFSAATDQASTPGKFSGPQTFLHTAKLTDLFLASSKQESRSRGIFCPHFRRTVRLDGQ
jgi:hypothetical protein